MTVVTVRLVARENDLTTRKIKRNQEKQAKKKLKQDIQEKMNMFDKLPDECLACQTVIDKKNREMISTWSVVVREDRVNLYCPTCWGAAQSVIKEYIDGQADSKNNV